MFLSSPLGMLNISRPSRKIVIFVTGYYLIAGQRPRCLGSNKANIVSLVNSLHVRWKVRLSELYPICMGTGYDQLDIARNILAYRKVCVCICFVNIVERM